MVFSTGVSMEVDGAAGVPAAGAAITVEASTAVIVTRGGLAFPMGPQAVISSGKQRIKVIHLRIGGFNI